MSQLKLTLFVALVVGVLGQSSALRCYICDYDSTKPDPSNCQNNPADSLLVEITDDMLEPINPPAVSSNDPIDTFLRKFTSPVSAVRSTSRSTIQADVWPFKACAKISGSSGGQTIISRIALGSKVDGQLVPGCRTESSGGIDMKLCICTSDGCNKSNNDGDYPGLEEPCTTTTTTTESVTTTTTTGSGTTTTTTESSTTTTTTCSS